jgi:hypothetical protein
VIFFFFFFFLFEMLMFLKDLDKARRGSEEHKAATPQILVHHAENSPAGFKPISTKSAPAASSEQQSWDFWRPLEHMMERLFPKDLFGASPPKPSNTMSPPRGNTRNLFDSDEPSDNNAMMESFMVVADYEPPSGGDSPEKKPVLKLTKKQSSVLDSVMHGKLLLEDDNAELRQLVEKL